MTRNLDLTALRSFVAVADVGGVTRAAGLLNLTQSAVSMQLKRLEESLGVTLLDRSARTVALTSEGDQLLGFARRMLVLNDEAFGRLTSAEFEGTIRIGVPDDIVYPAMPLVLQAIARRFPRLRVDLVSDYTSGLKESFAKGEIEIILTTEEALDEGGETLEARPLVWIGAPGGTAWRQRPLRLAFEDRCRFRAEAQRRLDDAGIPWNMAVQNGSPRTIQATVSADLAVQAAIDGTQGVHYEVIDHGGALPELSSVRINLYAAKTLTGPMAETVVGLIRAAFRGRLSGRDDDFAGGLATGDKVKTFRRAI